MSGSAVNLGRPATYEDLLTVPDHLVAEILDGELFTSPRPASPHAYTAGAIHGGLYGSFHGPGGRGRGPGGWWLLFEPELHVGPDVVVPDLAGWRIGRMAVVPDVRHFDIIPDWACEVSSPHTVRIDRVKKMTIYAREGLRHLWLVDPLARTLEVYRLESGRWVVAIVRGGDDVLRAEPFEEIEVDLARWWLPGGAPSPATP